MTHHRYDRRQPKRTEGFAWGRSIDKVLGGHVLTYRLFRRDLAGHLARITGADIGEHSSANCPWQNAIEASEQYKPAQAVDLGPVRDVFRSWHANELNSTDAMLALVEALAVIDSQAVGNG